MLTGATSSIPFIARNALLASVARMLEDDAMRGAARLSGGPGDRGARLPGPCPRRNTRRPRGAGCQRQLRSVSQDWRVLCAAPCRPTEECLPSSNDRLRGDPTRYFRPRNCGTRWSFPSEIRFGGQRLLPCDYRGGSSENYRHKTHGGRLRLG